MKITQKAGWYDSNLNSSIADLDYDSLSNNINKFDIMKQKENSDNEDSKQEDDDMLDDESFKNNYEDICKQSKMPIIIHQDYWDDKSSESYAPHSDWHGPDGKIWMNQ